MSLDKYLEQKQDEAVTPHVVSMDKTSPPQLKVSVAIYLASANGFENYCKGCENLAEAEETGNGTFPFRIHCSEEHCTKTSSATLLS